MRAITTVACLTLTAPALAEPVTGRVVDAAGRPVAGAEVATFWSFTPDGAAAYNSATTGDTGAFNLDVSFYNRPTAIMALSADRATGGLIVVDPADAAAQQTITLGPLVEVAGDFYCPEFEAKPTWTNVYMSVMPGRMRIASSMSEEAEFTFSLPPGEYEFWGYGRDVQNLRKTVTLSADEPAIDMGTVDLEATIIARHYGKAPPAINVTEARGADADVKLADYRNQWLLVEFWGYW
ncbi:MAG: hypothetical protein ACF8R7_02705 [Phycisphaerales bacterium JB039]